MPQTLIGVSELHELMAKTLREHFELSDSDADTVAAEFVAAEAEGRITHGIGKFLTIAPAARSRGIPEVKFDYGAVAIIDGHRELGFLAAPTAVTIAVEKAQKFGVGAAILSNFSRYSRLKPYVRQIANAGAVGVVLNGGGPSAVVPPGGRRAVLGTNPIAFGFPSSDGEPLLIDFATSTAVWGEIRQALLRGTDLPAESFVDIEGEVTRDPNSAEGVLSFGGAKGFALCLAIELLSALSPNASVGTDVDSEYDLGALFLAINPAVTGEGFATKVRRLKEQLYDSVPEANDAHRSIPGLRSTRKGQKAFEEGQIMVDSETLRQLKQTSSGHTPEMVINDKTN